MSNEPIRLEQHDLYSPQVESYLEERDSLARRDVGEIDPTPRLLRIIYSPFFYLSIASACGALVAWACLEPYFDDKALHQGGKATLVAFLMFPTVAAGIGFFLGAVEGLMCRNYRRALITSLVGLAVGFVGGLASIIVGGIVFSLMTGIAQNFMKANGRIGGMALVLFMMGRAAAWAVAAIPAGIGQGIALKERKVVQNGLIGGVLGGLLGGLLFDPIDLMLTGLNGDASVSRAVGFAVIGLFVGLFVGLVESWTKTAWLLMQRGPLAGKQFVLYRNPTVLGSSPKADVYLFKDDAIEPRHALIHNRGGRYEIEDLNTPDGTYVNGVPVRRHVLANGDQIVLGKTVLEFQLRETK